MGSNGDAKRATRPAHRRLPALLAATASSIVAVLGAPAALAEEPTSAPEGAAAQADTEPEPAQAPEPVEVVVTGTRTPESSQRATVRTQVVTREEAERRGATNVGEALEGQLGVTVNPSAYGALGRVSAIQIQGFDRERVLVLEDGERVIGDTGGAIDLSAMPLSEVARIELVTGPTSSLYGTSAIGGVVNVISAPPEVSGPSVRARLEARSAPGYLAALNTAYRRERAWIGLDASLDGEEGVALDPGLPDLWLPHRTQRLLGLRAGAPLGDRAEVRVRARWLHDDQEGLETQQIPGLGAYLIDLPEETDRVSIHLAESVDLGGGSNLRIGAGRQWAHRLSRRDRRDSPVDEERERSGTLQSFELTGTVADGPRTWVVGARAEVELLEQGLARAEARPSGVETSAIDEVPETKLGSGAAYAQLAWKLGEALTFLPGVRGEMHLRYGGVIAPRLALAYRPSENIGLRLSGGRGFRAPSAKEIGFSFDHSYLGYRVAGNPDLRPETSWGVNGDVTWTPEDRFTFRVGAFANWIEDLIDVDELTPIDSSGGVDTYAYRNIGRARTTGVDVSLTARATSWLRAELGYAYLWTRDDTAERPLEGRPPHTVQAALRAELPFALELVLRYRAVTDAFLDEGLRSPPFDTLDARLSRPLWPSSQVYVGVKNAFDVQKDAARLGDHRPIEGRTIYLGVVAELPWEENEP